MSVRSHPEERVAGVISIANGHIDTSHAVAVSERRTPAVP